MLTPVVFIGKEGGDGDLGIADDAIVPGGGYRGR